MEEKRKYKRFPVICKAECTNAKVLVLDMSREGMNIETSYDFKNKEEISLTLVLPNFDIIKIVCDIIWENINENNEFIYGVKIKKLSQDHEIKYFSFIKEIVVC